MLKEAFILFHFISFHVGRADMRSLNDHSLSARAHSGELGESLCGAECHRLVGAAPDDD